MGSNNKYRDHLEEILLQDSRFRDENDEIDGRAVKIYAQKLDEKLIGYLLEDDKSREKFFLEINDAYVFKANDFNFFLEQNRLDNSFTKYANQIGLTLDGKYLKDTSDIVLDFPYKDCVLEGGQSTEEGEDTCYEFDEEVTKTQQKKGYKPNQYNKKQTGREEIFYNNIIAKDEIDRLEEPKAFENIAKFTENGEESFEKFNRNEKGVITENLLIKGNNLLALHSLKEEFKEKVKLIYIDPPFNTGNDSFSYNDNFNHSTWLTFMKNRLQIAKQLISDDGFLCFHIDDQEVAYARVLLDEAFGSNNFVNTICIKDSHPSGLKLSHKDKKIIKTKSYIHVYKASDKARINPIYQKRYNWDTHFNKFVEIDDKDLPHYSLSKYIRQDEIVDKDFSLDEDSLKNKPFREFSFENRDKIFQSTKEIPTDAKKRSNKNEGQVIEYEGPNGEREFAYNGRRLSPLSRSIWDIGIDGYEEYDFAKLICDFWDDIDFNNTQNEGDVSFPNGKKPEYLLARLITMFTEKKDLVLDFFIGSGTTTAVAHKMGRQYLGVEQLEYGANGALNRMKNVLDGENSGVSNMLNWQGGGSFVYLELAKNNEKAKKTIEQCESLEELTSLFDELYEKYFLHYNVKIKEFKEEIIKEEQFKKLSLHRQKEMFCRVLDNNQMYVNRDEMEDTHFNLTEGDIALTKDFYKIEN